MDDAGFAKALLLTLGYEGGQSDRACDRGGHTYRGITQRRYDAWRDQCGEPRADVVAICDAELESLYWTGYWKLAHCPDLEPLLACMQFDSAVNHGPANAIRLLQRALRFDRAQVDGTWGPETERALVSEVGTLRYYFTVRHEFYLDIERNDSTQMANARGWENRLINLARALGVAYP